MKEGIDWMCEINGYHHRICVKFPILKTTEIGTMNSRVNDWEWDDFKGTQKLWKTWRISMIEYVTDPCRPLIFQLFKDKDIFQTRLHIARYLFI